VTDPETLATWHQKRLIELRRLSVGCRWAVRIYETGNCLPSYLIRINEKKKKSSRGSTQRGFPYKIVEKWKIGNGKFSI